MWTPSEANIENFTEDAYEDLEGFTSEIEYLKYLVYLETRFED